MSKEFGGVILVDTSKEEPLIRWIKSDGTSMESARKFLNHFRRALNYAMKEQRKIYQQKSDTELRKGLSL